MLHLVAREIRELKLYWVAVGVGGNGRCTESAVIIFGHFIAGIGWRLSPQPHYIFVMFWCCV